MKVALEKLGVCSASDQLNRKAIRSGVEFFLPHSSFDRGCHLRELLLMSVSSYPYPCTESCHIQEDLDTVLVALFTTKTGDNSKQYTSCYPRSKDVLFCPVFWLMLSVFTELCVFGSHKQTVDGQDLSYPGRGLPSFKDKEWWTWHVSGPWVTVHFLRIVVCYRLRAVLSHVAE